MHRNWVVSPLGMNAHCLKWAKKMDLTLKTVNYKSYAVALWPESGHDMINYLQLIKIQLHLMAFSYSEDFLLFFFLLSRLWTNRQLTNKQKNWIRMKKQAGQEKESTTRTSFGVFMHAKCIHLLNYCMPRCIIYHFNCLWK